MAGSEKTGVENARPDMFEGAVTILTTTASTNRNALRRISEFWRRLGSSVSILTPKAHDEIVSMVSHLPHAAAVSLLLAQKKASLPFAAGGFKDYTRIASSETEMWLDILRNNRIAIIAALDVFMRELSAIRGDLFRKDTKALAGKLRKAKLIRDSIT
jgi:prephenate dehydrogenase